MLPYVFRRALSCFLTLVFLITLTFFLLRLAPGGPFDSEQAWPEEIKRNILEHYGLDRPLYEQYWTWLSDAAQGNFHDSFQYNGRPVREIIFEALPASLALGFGSLFFSILVGIPLGALAAWNQNNSVDRALVAFTVSGISLPNYLLASILVLVFSLKLGWLPPALWEGPESLVLPALTLSLKPIAMLARLSRTSIIETLTSDYIRTARAKGLSDRVVLFKHALRNSLIPVITLLGPLAANLITGSFVVEMVFQIPGLGKHFVSSILNRDYPLVMGLTVTYGIFLLTCNLAVDIAYGWIDPRMRLKT